MFPLDAWINFFLCNFSNNNKVSLPSFNEENVLMKVKNFVNGLLSEPPKHFILHSYTYSIGPIFDLTHSRELGQKYTNFLLSFLVQIKTLKFASKIYGPLVCVVCTTQTSNCDTCIIFKNAFVFIFLF